MKRRYLLALFPLTALALIGHAFGADSVVTDDFQRVIAAPGKQATACPPQTGRTAVLLIIGQSNSANHAERLYRSAHGTAILNFFDGRCYLASSPLLGASGTTGESWTLLGDKLVEGGLFDRVILVTSGIGGSPIAQWQQDGYLNGMLMGALDSVLRQYRVTHVLWHQGETDFEMRTLARDYAARFTSLAGSLRARGISAPIFVSIASMCDDIERWGADNPVARAQRALVDPRKGIFMGVDTDALIGRTDRHDGCHFAAAGQEAFADAWLALLRRQALGDSLP